VRWALRELLAFPDVTCDRFDAWSFLAGSDGMALVDVIWLSV